MQNFFVTHEGDLVRHRDCTVIRPQYMRHHATIENTQQLRATLRAGRTTDAGGYPLYLVFGDGAACCFDCARKEYKTISGAIREDGTHNQWRIVGCAVNWEDTDLYCEHCSAKIPSAYGEEN